MLHKTFAETIDERLKAIGLLADCIALQPEQSDLHDLRVLLLDVMGLLKRDPGIESAADDLYAAAMALVRDKAVGAQPIARKQRLLKDARSRFFGRLNGAAERIGPQDLRLKGFAAFQAAHLSRKPASEARSQAA
ncbi:hypothetical protein [Microvirga pudoricolor]|uniref:hypothetical protein n=1 Tax=Microvirga pudoricolor TaxID=2778729 RepID=UPI0019515073|nr:hypothetical protein [Microvirga pudoricolor]MBM6595447.1 hypothetical protein [Microvirga pudoricolor]